MRTMKEVLCREYELIEASWASKLSSLVNEKLAEGWELHGSPVVTAWTDTTGDWPQCKVVYAQAVVRDVF